jgi:hypothetical protein
MNTTPPISKIDLGPSTYDPDVNLVCYATDHGHVAVAVSENGRGSGAWILEMEVDENVRNQGIMTHILDKVFADHTHVTPGVIVATHADKVLGVMQRLAATHNTTLGEYRLDPAA